MKLLEERAPREVAVAVTYNVDLAWFEAFVQPSLRARGVRQIIVFADSARVSEILALQGPVLRSAGTWYQLVPVTAPGAFHPKALLTTGAEGASLYVGTGNLTSSGYGRNLEAFERWTVESGATSISPAFRAFAEFLRELATSRVDLPQSATRVLDEAFSYPVFGLPEHEDSRSVIWTAGQRPLVDELPAAPSAATSMCALAPFFDPPGKAIVALAQRLRASSPEVWTDARTTSLRKPALAAIERAGGTVQVLDEENEERLLHAKLLYARGRDWKVGVVGSANLSAAAWLGGNVELAVLRTGDAADSVNELLRSRRLRELDEYDHDEWLAAEVDDDEDVPAGPHISCARYNDDSTIALRASEPFDAVEVVVGGRTVGVPSWSFGKDEAVLELEERCRGVGVTLLRATSSRGVGAWALVSDPAALAERAERARLAVQELERLGFVEYDPSAVERFYNLLLRVARDRRQPDTASSASRASGASGHEGQPRYVRFTDADFQDDSESTVGAEMRRRLRLAPTRLMEALLFGGDEAGDASADEGESANAEADEDAQDDFADQAKAVRRRDPARRQKFRERAAKVREAYLARSDVLTTGRDARRLLEDLLVLTAPLHLLLRHGDLDRHSFLSEMVLVLRAFLGGPAAPLVHRLRTLEHDESQTLWATTPLGLQLCLLVYNVLLAQVGDRDPEREAVKVDSGVLWLGRLLSCAPEDELQRLGERAEQRLVGLQRGALWIGDEWPVHSSRSPFPDFVRRSVANARGLAGLFEELRRAVEEGRCKPGIDQRPFVAGDLDEAIVVQLSHHEVVPGFAEYDERHRRLTVWLRPGLFLAPEPEGMVAKMPRVDAKAIIELEVARECLDDSHEQAFQLVEALA